jgi:hypothetical protein
MLRPRSFNKGSGTTHSLAVPKTIKKSKPKTPVDNTEKIAENYINNLQGQIHLLKLETELLTERVDEAKRITSDESLKINEFSGVRTRSLEPVFIELKDRYDKLERQYKEERSV